MKKLLSLSGSFLIVVILAALILSSCATGPPPAELIGAQEQWNLEQMDLWRSAGFVKKEVQVDSDRIVYMEGGQGETVLFMYGYACNKGISQRMLWIHHKRGGRLSLEPSISV